jgi:hypothetical protein
MPEFKGFGNWIEIFKGGKQLDSNGKEHDGDAIIDRAVKNFDAKKHEPPLVVGHPQNNAPAFGWVQGLKKSGGRLLAKFKDVVPEFEAIAKQGLYKKRSASFYPDGRLRHVGFLGAAPPAVKGLADLKFDDDAESICFENNIKMVPGTKKKEDKAMTFKDFTEIFKFWKTVEDNPDLELPAFKAKPASAAGDDKPSFTEADIEAAKKEASEAEREKVTKEFAEKQLTAKREARNKEISDWCDGLIEEGKVIPAWVKMGLKEFCLNLDAEKTVEFSEENKTTALDWFKSFVDELPKVVVFKELATRDADISGGDAGGKLEALIKKAMKENKDLDYSAAFSEVQRDNPALAAEYQQELGG